jgi:hypothetical protein
MKASLLSGICGYKIGVGSLPALRREPVVSLSLYRIPSIGFHECLRVQFFPQRLIGLPHGPSYIEASDSRTRTFPTLFFLAVDFGIRIFLVFGLEITVPGTLFVLLGRHEEFAEAKTLTDQLHATCGTARQALEQDWEAHGCHAQESSA